MGKGHIRTPKCLNFVEFRFNPQQLPFIEPGNEPTIEYLIDLLFHLYALLNPSPYLPPPKSQLYLISPI